MTKIIIAFLFVLISVETLQADDNDKDVLRANNGVFGRYVGVLRHEALKKDQLAKLDFVLSRESGNKLELMAILTLHFGDFISREYVAYHFDNVQYNLLTQTLVFDQPNTDITIRVTNFGNGKFEGEVRSNFSGSTSQLILSEDASISLKYPLVEPVSGEYEGKCLNSETSRLQLHTYRSTEDTSRIGNPFATYRVLGDLSQYNAKGCDVVPRPASYCTTVRFNTASYNFFKSRLIISGSKQSFDCNTVEGGISCTNGCELKRRSNEMTAPLELTPRISQSSFGNTFVNNDPALTVPVESLGGEYTGFLHHEYLNTYQPASLNILTFQGSGNATEEKKLQLSAVATLFFGELNSSEAINYRFETRPYPNPLVDRQFVFKRSEQDVDAVLQVTHFGEGVVRGVWNSILFGRVGSFELRKDGNVAIPSHARKMDKVSAILEGNEHDIYLNVSLGKTPPNTENPFSPLVLSGKYNFRVANMVSTMTSGSYDFYTGKIGFEFDDKKIAFLGTRDEARGTLSLRKCRYDGFTLSNVLPFALEPYRKIPFTP